MEKRTCGPMYLEAIKKYGVDFKTTGAFTAGFISGQAEKIYLGACHAAMFRPSIEKQPMVEMILNDVCARYGLEWVAHPFNSEYWMYRPDPDVKCMLHDCFNAVCNGVTWHSLRGILCGVPTQQLDANFHERDGYNKRCD